MRLNESGDESEFALNIGLQRIDLLIPFPIFRGQDPKLPQVIWDLVDCAIVSAEEFPIAGENEILSRVAGPKNLPRYVFEKRRDLAGVANRGFTG